MAASWPPRLEAPGPDSPGSGAMPNLSFTLELLSVVARLNTYGQLRRNSSLPSSKDWRLCSSW
jgi:hypothetical protein